MVSISKYSLTREDIFYLNTTTNSTKCVAEAHILPSHPDLQFLLLWYTSPMPIQWQLPAEAPLEFDLKFLILFVLFSIDTLLLLPDPSFYVDCRPLTVDCFSLRISAKICVLLRLDFRSKKVLQLMGGRESKIREDLEQQFESKKLISIFRGWPLYARF